MKTYRKIMMVIAVAIPLSLIPNKCAKATAAGDAALLGQQIAQFMNDILMDEWKLDEFTTRMEKLERIVGMINTGSTIYNYMNDMNHIFRLTEMTTRRSIKFTKYACSLDNDDLDLDSVMWTTSVCLNNMSYIYEGLNDTWDCISELFDDPKDAADAQDEIMEKTKQDIYNESLKLDYCYADFDMTVRDHAIKSLEREMGKLTII